MLPKYSTMFSIIFAVCSFGIIHSQPQRLSPPYSSSSQSVSDSEAQSSSVVSSGPSTANSRTGAAYASSSGSAISSSRSQTALTADSNTQLQPSVPLTIGDVSHYVKQLLSNSHVLNTVPDFVVSDALMNNVKRMVWDQRNIQIIAPETGRNGATVTKDLYLNTVSHMLAKVLYMNNILTQESAYTYPRIFISYVEDYGTRNGVSNVLSVVQAVENGFIDFMNSIRLLNVPNIRLVVELYRQELNALASGEEI